jgi:1-deoxy-D-xylulose-5-phosphate reductoisomerase
MKKIALVGSCGSIGRQVADVVRAYPDQYKIVALISRSAKEQFTLQAEELKPSCLCLTDKDAAINVSYSAKIFYGDKGALKCLEECGADVVFVACGGFAGLKYSLKAIELKCDLALANKETLVCGGDIVMPKVKNIFPVDSEHSAIWQCLNFDRSKKLKNLIITASGGPFKNCKWENLKGVTPEQALNHPTWKMGKKITIDSATLLNKGYEVIEAHHLYGTPYENIKTVIQPQSIIHSMVEFDDGAILAQMSNPTMELPIQLALSFPERLATTLKPLDFTRAFSIDFMPLVRQNYPLYDLALTCGERGGVLPTALNAASEVAVGAFLDGRITFTAIYDVARAVVEGTKNARAESYEQLEEVDTLSRSVANKLVTDYDK